MELRTTLPLPLVEKNARLEKMRLKVKGSLFDRQPSAYSDSTPANKNDFDDDVSTGASPSKKLPSLTGDAFSPNGKNPKLEKLRNKMKGSIGITSYGSFTALELPSAPFDENGELGLSQNSSQDDSTCKSRPDRVYGFDEIKQVNFIHEDGTTEQIEVFDGSPNRHSVFYNNLEYEIESLKQELNVGEDPDIHFIKSNFNDYYEEDEVLGEGTTATVKKCFRNTTREAFAAKIIHYRDDTEMLVLIIKEFKNYKRLIHPHIIRVHELYVDYWQKKIYTIMELAECREMFEVLQDLGQYSEAVASSIFKQILAGITYLHTNGVCHRDLKPNNILVSEDGKIVKITDFNVSKFTEDKSKKYSALSTQNNKMWTHTGTIAFTAPEVFIDSEYTESVDMWSAGVVLYVMLSGYQPFQAEYVQELITLITKAEVDYTSEPWDKISDYAKDLVKRCLDPNPKTRTLPSEALMHPWIANLGNVSNESISEILDNLKSYKNKNKRKDRRAITRADDLNNTKFLANIRSKAKRFGTTVAPSDEREESDSESKEENNDARERKSQFLSRLKENLPAHMQREVPKRSTFAVVVKNEILESVDDECSPDLKKNGHNAVNNFPFDEENSDEVEVEEDHTHTKAYRKSSSYDKINDDFFHGKSDDDELEYSR